MFGLPKYDSAPTEAEIRCKHPCKKMTNTVSVRAENVGVGTSETGETETLLILNFKKTVRIEKSIVVYTFFNFIIDIGSSLGLWLGLSALGITDLAIDAFQLAKTWIRPK